MTVDIERLVRELETLAEFSDAPARSVVIEAGKRLKIEKLIWDS